MKDSVQQVLDLMQQTFGSEFATYYNGDPEAIPLVNLPAIVVIQTNDDTAEGQFGEDDVEDKITIKLVLNKRDDFDASRADPLNLTESKLRKYVAYRGVNGQYDPKTVKGAVRSLMLDGVEAVAPTMTIEYGINPRVPGTGLADLTAEAHVTFSIQYPVHTY